ncbi:hypothetical protein AB0395_44795 [Streptosporangium sp. NPDC051023]|uniref:hypothetical protein n=1 Tax=Streptosporangium sp. NPDC051023 TaxID=3155410 RepID=UPI00344EF59A
MFSDKGDTYHGGTTVTCGGCGVTSTGSNSLMDHTCSCGRVLNGVGRRDEPDLTKK